MAVVVISLGGTIASTPSSTGGGARPELSGAELVGAVPGLDEAGEIRTHEFANVPSTQLSLGDMYDLVEVVRAYDADDAVTGVVVTQGTDILEEVAFFVDRCYGGRTPVVFTGAMRNPSLASPDGAGNLLASVRTASDSGARDRGVLVAFNDRIHRAATVTKMHSMNLDTFRSPERGPVGAHDEDRIRWFSPPPRDRTALEPDPRELSRDVHASFVVADMSPAELPVPDDCTALCLATTGAGHVPTGILPRLRNLVESDVPVVATTRCPEGRLARRTYDFEGSERTLLDIGCYVSPWNLQKTRIAAVVGLAAGSLDDVFERPTFG
jgi:L-asparaginase